jgi:hypothetical protein
MSGSLCATAIAVARLPTRVISSFPGGSRTSARWRSRRRWSIGSSSDLGPDFGCKPASSAAHAAARDGPGNRRLYAAADRRPSRATRPSAAAQLAAAIHRSSMGCPPENPVRRRLAAGAKRIRTLGPTRVRRPRQPQGSLLLGAGGRWIRTIGTAYETTLLATPFGHAIRLP